MQARIKETVLKALTKLSPGKILDVPSGTAWLQTSLGDRWEYHGADLYTDPDAKNFVQADLNKPLPYDDEQFDVVTCLEGLEHIENYHQAMREFCRVVKPGGKVIISTPNPLNVKSRRRYLWRGTFNGFPHLVHMPADGEHVHVSPINLSFLIAFANKYGLQCQGVNKVRIPWKMWRFLPRAALIRLKSRVENSTKDEVTQGWMEMVNSYNVLLNDGMVVSFVKRD